MSNKILAVDTSSSSGSVALVDGSLLVVEWNLQSAKTHNRRLLKTIHMLLSQAGWTMEEVDTVAVTTGPGSFTGLRIGITTMKTLAWACGKRYVGIPTLDVLAAPLSFANTTVCPLMNARKEEVYFAFFVPDGKGNLHRQSPYAVDSPERVVAKIKGPTVFCGDGWRLHGSLFVEALGEWALEAPGPFHVIRASFVAELARRRISDGLSDDALTSAPLYIRPSEAEIQYPHLSTHLR